MLVTLDPHGPAMMRVNQTLSNIPEFAASFGIAEGMPMHKRMANKGEMVDIW
jgi:predicted metalloendopeptidase